MASIQGVEQLAGAVGRVTPEGVTSTAYSNEKPVLEAIEEAAREEFGSRKRPELFDASAFAVGSTVDGKDIDEIQVSLSGSVKFPGDLAEAQDLFEALRLGKPVDITVTAYVATKAGAYKESKDGDPIVTGKVGLKVLGLGVLKPEDLD